MHHNTIALDIVLFPPEEIAKEAKSYNEELLQQNPAGLCLDATHLPHMTLMQLYANSEKLPDIVDSIRTISHQFQALPLRINGIKGIALENERAFFLTLDPQPELFRLHRDLMNKLQTYEVATDAKAFLLDADEEARPSTLAYTKNFREQVSFDHFDPHITIGTGEQIDFRNPMEFLASQLAICHLGNFNTCRKILWETQLGR
ncbi:MAG: 2'-5' RNA ligase family protein [Candidatus Nomurabacteria bacterium]|nr:MAG: 2'-5' RNA ligase family protein [Candidatus Nomurabacteria bacterium]